ncbi:MAG: sn-glycerol-1-phosphate dehydrogenase [bacterium]
MLDLSPYLQRYQDRLDTHAIRIETRAIENGLGDLQTHLPAGKWLVAVDDNTWRVAGERLAAVLDAAGQPWQRWDVPCLHDEEHPMCDDARVDLCQAALKESGAVAGVAVGSGTINDVVKLAAFKAGIPMACVGTAPSMNGFTSGIAAVLSDGVKTTVPCTAPVVVIADVDVMAESPARMIQSGLGDLLSKPVSNSDWALSAILTGSAFSEEAMGIIEAGSDMLDGVAPKLPSRDREAVAGLCGSLMLSGLAMSVAGSSSPASGGEHLISHFIDMTAHAYDLPYDFHGCQVGVGTLTTAFIYEKLKALDPATIDIEQRVGELLPWEDYREVLRERFDVLFSAVEKHAHPAYPTRDQLRARLTEVIARWDELMVGISHTLRTEASIEGELRDAGCPVRFKDLGIDRERARAAVLYSKDIRNRYTILHLAWELGLLDAWGNEALDLLWE